MTSSTSLKNFLSLIILRPNQTRFSGLPLGFVCCYETTFFEFSRSSDIRLELVTELFGILNHDQHFRTLGVKQLISSCRISMIVVLQIGSILTLHNISFKLLIHLCVVFAVIAFIRLQPGKIHMVFVIIELNEMWMLVTLIHYILSHANFRLLQFY